MFDTVISSEVIELDKTLRESLTLYYKIEVLKLKTYIFHLSCISGRMLHLVRYYTFLHLEVIRKFL